VIGRRPRRQQKRRAFWTGPGRPESRSYPLTYSTYLASSHTFFPSRVFVFGFHENGEKTS
jgi:hypothetical protein